MILCHYFISEVRKAVPSKQIMVQTQMETTNNYKALQSARITGVTHHTQNSGRPKWADHLSLGVRDQAAQHIVKP